MQLLKITTIPIKYSIKIEHAKLQANQDNIQIDKLEKNSSSYARKTDKFDREKGVCNQQTPNLRSFATQISSQNSAGDEASQNTNPTGTNSNITASDIVKTKLLKDLPEHMVFLPNTGPQVSFDSDNLNMEYTPSNLNLNWKIDPIELDFVPGSFVVNVEQYPEIKIEYLGKPMYIPPSADPDYKEKKE